MKIGDKVRFLSEVGGGIVKGFRGKDIVLVEDADGFDIPMQIRECVVIDTDDYNMTRKVAPAPKKPEEPVKPVKPEIPVVRSAEVRGGDVLNVFLACFSYGVEVDAGPSLIFITLPNVFVNMQGGRIWGCLFFLFMTFASFSTVIAVFENIMSFAIDMFGWSRNKAALINGVIILIASMPCVLGYNVWSNLHLIGGRDVLDSEDFMVSNLLLPIGSLVYLLFCVTKWGWGFDKYIDEANTGSGLKISRKLKPYFQFILPLLILFIFIQGLI